MDETTVQYWPQGVPETLWNYGLMQAQQPPPFPFMGLRFEPGFLVAFVFGLLFVAFFAWRRFKEKTFDAKSFSYRVLTELDLTALRGGAAMRRAYLIYAGTLVLLYLGMTFFGKLILETVGQLPIAGAHVDTSGLNFSSPQWPLMLAFGFAGLAPLLPPLEAAETWLRRRAHQAVGIPTRIDQLARLIIDNFDRRLRRHSEADDSAATNSPSAVAQQVPLWARTHLGGDAVVARIGKVHEELRQFKEWSQEEDPDWPNRSVRSDLRSLERRIVADADVVLREYDDILRQPQADTADANEPEPDAQARRKQMRHRLDQAIQRMNELRGDLAAIIAVYAEGDRDFGKIVKPQHRDLREALTETFAFLRVRTGPEVALVAALPVIFLIYAIACATELHPLLKPVQLTPWTAVVTASLETLRFASIFTLPSVAAFALRFYLLDRASWDRATLGRTPRLTTTERLVATMLGAAASAILLCLVALLWAAVLSPTSTHFQQLLFRDQGGFLIYFVQQAGTSALVLFLSLVACDATGPRAGAKRRLLGAACAVLVLAWLAAIFHGGWACSDPNAQLPLAIFTDEICFRDNSGLDYLIYPVVAYLTCAVFGTMPAEAPERNRRAAVARLPRHAAATTAGVLGAALTLLVASTGPAQSQGCADPAEPRCAGAGCAESCEVTIGFRADAEPFSYLVETDERQQFHGYLADLCYALFNGSAYRLKSTEVTVHDRFGRVRGAPRPEPGPPVDMLCDPLTLRFSKPEQELRGFYSPIVFASGATYLLRKSNAARAVAYLGYARASTAEKVARKACQVDLLRIREPGESSRPNECDLPRTETEIARAKADPRCGSTIPAPTRTAPRVVREEPAYVFCPKDDHAELIRWFCRSAELKDKDGRSHPTDNLDFHMAYVGDREIIQGKLSAYVKQPKHQCPEAAIEADPSNYTYEPYALVVSLERPELAQFVQRRVFEYFSHPGNARGLFQKHFPKQQMSTALAYLYLLNGVMERDPFTVETITEDGENAVAPVPPRISGRQDEGADRQQVIDDARLLGTIPMEAGQGSAQFQRGVHHADP